MAPAAVLPAPAVPWRSCAQELRLLQHIALRVSLEDGRDLSRSPAVDSQVLGFDGAEIVKSTFVGLALPHKATHQLVAMNRRGCWQEQGARGKGLSLWISTLPSGSGDQTT